MRDTILSSHGFQSMYLFFELDDVPYDFLNFLRVGIELFAARNSREIVDIFSFSS